MEGNEEKDKETKEEEKETTTTTTVETKDSEESTKENTYTKEQLESAKNESANSVYKELGIDPKDKKSIAMFKAFISSQKTDEEKAADKEKADNERLEEAERKLKIAEAKAEAMALGVKSEYVEDVITLALSKVDDTNNLKSVLDGFKKRYSFWFGEETTETSPSKKSGTGSSFNSKEKKDKDGKGESLGARLAAQKKNGTKKSSYWG